MVVKVPASYLTIAGWRCCHFFAVVVFRFTVSTFRSQTRFSFGFFGSRRMEKIFPVFLRCWQAAAEILPVIFGSRGNAKESPTFIFANGYLLESVRDVVPLYGIPFSTTNVFAVVAFPVVVFDFAIARSFS